MAADLSLILPRVLIVSRRAVHLIVSYGAVPVIVPRVNGVHMLLESFEPTHGALPCEGEDMDPSHYNSESAGFSPEELEEIRQLHASD
ncbi:hypothetical protein RJ641_012207 [Dillenia turbinata]|uniref:Uncharacterized protein n=1 Tax=Dillenia turbinata TaxID=194707 RepID=A0AAN8UTE8_9MAGN